MRVVLGLYWGHWGYIGIMKKKMETLYTRSSNQRPQREKPQLPSTQSPLRRRKQALKTQLLGYPALVRQHTQGLYWEGHLRGGHDLSLGFRV